MIIILFLLILILLYYLRSFVILKKKLNYLNKYLDNNNDPIHIISNDPCKCNRLSKLIPIFKCKKCKVPNIINFENINQVFDFLSKLENKKCNLIIHTEGGASSNADTLSRLLVENNINVTTYIPQYAKSAGTMIALSSNKIYMNWYSVMSPIDTQLYIDDDDMFPAKFIKTIKDKEGTESKDYIRSLEAESVHKVDEFLLSRILDKNANKQKIIKRILNTKYSHDIDYINKDLKDMGLPIYDEIPKNITEIFNIYHPLFDL